MFNSIGSKKLVIPTPAHAISLASPGISQQANRVDIQALRTNTHPIIIGGNTISSDQSAGGIELDAGEVYNIEIISDLANIFAHGFAGEGISINWWIGEVN